MLLPIVEYGSAILREKSVPVAEITPELKTLVEDMLETMHAANGVGLAAQQIGRRERLCVIDIPDGCETESDAIFNLPIQMPLVMINPQILGLSGEGICEREGCLSFPGVGGRVTRAEQVMCRYTDLQGREKMITARGFLARAIQHETDHLDAVLYIDRMEPDVRRRQKKKLNALAHRNGDVM